MKGDRMVEEKIWCGQVTNYNTPFHRKKTVDKPPDDQNTP